MLEDPPPAEPPTEWLAAEEPAKLEQLAAEIVGQALRDVPSLRAQRPEGLLPADTRELLFKMAA